MALTDGSIIDRLQKAADRPTGVRFVGASVMSADGPNFISWAQIHDEARAVGAALQARHALTVAGAKERGSWLAR